MADRKSILVWSIFLPAICAAALAVRLHPVLAHPESERYGFGPFGDTFIYCELAVNLCAGKGFVVGGEGAALTRGPLPYRPAFERGPGYPLFISAVFRLTGSLPDTRSLRTVHLALDRVRFAQCILDTLCLVLVFCIVRVLRPGARWAPVCAAALYAVSWYTIFYTRAILAETLAAFLLTLFLLIAMRGIRDGLARRLVQAGMVIGFLNLCRPGYVVFLPCFALFLLLAFRSVPRKACGLALAFLAGALGVITPWTVRNYMAFGKPVLIAAGVPGVMLYWGMIDSGSNWRGWGAFPDVAFVDDEEKRIAPPLFAAHPWILRDGSLDDVDRVHREFLRLAWKRFRARPGEVMRNWARKMPRLWFQNYVPIYRDPEASGLYFLCYFAFAIVAWCACPRARLLMSPVALLFAYLTIICAPIVVEPRFGVPLMPGIIAMAGVGICDTAGWLARLRARMAKSSTGGREP